LRLIKKGSIIGIMNNEEFKTATIVNKKTRFPQDGLKICVHVGVNPTMRHNAGMLVVNKGESPSQYTFGVAADLVKYEN
jgi:hypothetical protein